MISPTACGALVSARTTPQPSHSWNPGGTPVEPQWNPGGTLVEPSWNLTSGPPRTTPEPIWAQTPKLWKKENLELSGKAFCVIPVKPSCKSLAKLASEALGCSNRNKGQELREAEYTHPGETASMNLELVYSLYKSPFMVAKTSYAM